MIVAIALLRMMKGTAPQTPSFPHVSGGEFGKSTASLPFPPPGHPAVQGGEMLDSRQRRAGMTGVEIAFFHANDHGDYTALDDERGTPQVVVSAANRDERRLIEHCLSRFGFASPRSTLCFD
jgi:hypothetical protein